MCVGGEGRDKGEGGCVWAREGERGWEGECLRWRKNWGKGERVLCVRINKGSGGEGGGCMCMCVCVKGMCTGGGCLYLCALR